MISDFYPDGAESRFLRSIGSSAKLHGFISKRLRSSGSMQFSLVLTTVNIVTRTLIFAGFHKIGTEGGCHIREGGSVYGRGDPGQQRKQSLVRGVHADPGRQGAPER